jgi:uncharacterized repeat protein (TIGR01451 family)
VACRFPPLNPPQRGGVATEVRKAKRRETPDWALRQLQRGGWWNSALRNAARPCRWHALGCALVVLAIPLAQAHGDMDWGTVYRFGVGVSDTTAPTITCPPDLTVECGASTDPASTGRATATDDYDPSPTVIYSDTLLPLPGEWAIARTWRATDQSGNSTTCLQTITVRDTTPPVFSHCPSDIVVAPDPGECSRRNVTYTVLATDSCSDGTVTCVPTSGSTFEYGTTPVTCTARDAAGNTATCRFTVTVARPQLGRVRLSGGRVRLEWQAGSLQDASAITGGFTDVPGATSPYEFVPQPGARFFRLGGAVESENLVGCVGFTLEPGYTLLANPLLSEPSTVASLLEGLPDGMSVFTFEGKYVANNRLAGWSAPAMRLVPGQGFIVRNPRQTDLFVCLVGDVPQGAMSLDLATGYNLVACMRPQAGRLQADLGFVPANGDFVYRLASPLSAWTLQTYVIGAWSVQPSLRIGEAFWLWRTVSGAWNRAFVWDENACGGSHTPEYTSSPNAVPLLGAVNFFTYRRDPAYGRVHGLGWTAPLEGNAYLAQLYAGATRDSLAPVGTAHHFGVGASAGYVDGGVQSVALASGVEQEFELRVWETAKGATYEAALAAGGIYGRSAGFRLIPASPPHPPPNANLFRSFAIGPDITPPAIVCPDDITTTGDPGQSSRRNVVYSASATDDRSDVTLSYDPPSGSTFNVGTTTVTCTATDAAGNRATCRFHVTVLFAKCCDPPWNPTACCALCSPPYGRRLAVTVRPGQNALVNPFCRGSARENSLGALLPNVPDGTWIQKWNGALQHYGEPIVFVAETGWVYTGTGNDASDEPLPPGEGFFLLSPAAAFQVTWEGCNPEPACKPCGPAKNLSLRGPVGAVSGAATWSDLFRCPPQCAGTKIYVPDPFGGFSAYTYQTEAGRWDPRPPSWPAGQAVFVEVPAGADCCPDPLNIECGVGPNGLLVSNEPGRCDAVVEYATPAVSGGCPPVVTRCEPPSGSRFPLGRNVVTCTATDAAGKTAECTFPVAVQQESDCETGSLVINEWLGNNYEAWSDPADGQHVPWFELHNTSRVPADLGGFYLVHACCAPDWQSRIEFRIPANTLLAAGGFLLVVADEQPGQTTAGNLHVGFRLSPAGGRLGLYSPRGVKIDEVVYGVQKPDVSQGRFPDGSWACFDYATISPGGRNVPNPADPHTTRQLLRGPSCRSFKLVNVIPYESSGEEEYDGRSNLAVKGGDCRSLVMSSGGDGLDRLFTSRDGGWLWDNRLNLSRYFSTVEWGSHGAYLAGMGSTNWFDVQRSGAPETGTPFTPVCGSDMRTLGYWLGDPWLDLCRFGGEDYFHAGFLRPLGSAKVPAVWHGPAEDASCENRHCVQLDPAEEGRDAQAVRVAAGQDGRTVYAAFQRWNEPAHYIEDGAYIPVDPRGLVVVVRDDDRGLRGFADRVAVVARDVRLPCTTRLGHARIRSSLALAVSPRAVGRVYIAYVEVDKAGESRLRVRGSSDGGATFSEVFRPRIPAALPALAVAENGTVGLLYTALNGANLETRFLQAPNGDFSQVRDSLLARCGEESSGLLGDQDLEAEDNVFFGSFLASNEPDPAHFPSGIFYQRAVRVGGQIRSKFVLTANGLLCNPDSPGTPVGISLDPFFFREAALEPHHLAVSPGPATLPRVRLAGPPPDTARQFEFRWPVNLPPQPQWRIESTPALQPGAVWTPETQPVVASADGYFSVQLETAGASRFFRLRLEEPNPDIAYLVTAAAGTHGAVFPAGSLTRMGGQSATFAVIPKPGYGPDEWYLDGQLAQTGGSEFVLGNIQADHRVLATFAPRYDLAILQGARFVPRGEEGNTTVLRSHVYFRITVANAGIEPMTNVRVTDVLPVGLDFVSANSSQGTCQVQDRKVFCELGTLPGRGAASVTIDVLTTVTGEVMNTATVQGHEFELDTSNNSITEALRVEGP